MLAMSVFKTNRERNLAALRLFLVSLPVNSYQSFQMRVRKAAVCEKNLSVFLNVVYHRVGMCWLCQSEGLNWLVLICGHFPTSCAGCCVFQV